jgi:signal transduction histidine kinase
LIGNLLLLVVTLRFQLLKDALSSASAWAAGAVALAGVLAYVELFRTFAPTVALPLLAFATLCLVALSLAAPLGLAARRRTERLRRLATLGRVSDQLAHDLQNPLAALRGATQFLREEAARGRPLKDQLEFFDLIVAQADRMAATIDRYRRLGRVEPQLAIQDLNQLVQHTLALQPLAEKRVSMKLDLSPELLEVSLDADLFSAALHNLAKNAVEAMPEGGTLTVRTGRAQGPREAGVRLTVEDTGGGMDARVRERAFEDFFTTKPGGTGLGLAFVRRVTEAHGGEVLLSSREGQGTRVQLFLPTSGLAR